MISTCEDARIPRRERAAADTTKFGTCVKVKEPFNANEVQLFFLLIA